MVRCELLRASNHGNDRPPRSAVTGFRLSPERRRIATGTAPLLPLCSGVFPPESPAPIWNVLRSILHTVPMPDRWLCRRALGKIFILHLFQDPGALGALFQVI